MAETQPKWDATRVFILVIVVVFMVSSLAVSIAVIMELVKGDDTKKTTSTSDTTKPETQEGKLEGTKLAGFTPVDTVDSLQIIDLKEGTGDVVKAGDTVTAHYTGALAKDGTIFQSSHDTGNPIPFSLDGVIKGWQDGVPGMKVGGTRRLLIPAAQAYGDQAQNGIPANSDLVFDIELVKIGQ